jgi:CheY-like chemotaxis protein
MTSHLSGGVVKHVLQTEGFDVTDAASSAAALRLLSEVDVHLLITDIEMPGMNGLELSRAWRVDRPENAHVIYLRVAASDLPRFYGRPLFIHRKALLDG